MNKVFGEWDMNILRKLMYGIRSAQAVGQQGLLLGSKEHV